MQDRTATKGSKARKLVLKKDTVRVLDGKEAKEVIGGRIVDASARCTMQNLTWLSTKCCNK